MLEQTFYKSKTNIKVIRRTGTMKNKEVYKQAFKHVHLSKKEINLNQEEF